MLDKYSVQPNIFDNSITVVYGIVYTGVPTTYRVKHIIQYASYSTNMKILRNTKLFVLVLIEVSKYLHNFLVTLANRYSSVKFAMPLYASK